MSKPYSQMTVAELFAAAGYPVPVGADIRICYPLWLYNHKDKTYVYHNDQWQRIDAPFVGNEAGTHKAIGYYEILPPAMKALYKIVGRAQLDAIKEVLDNNARKAAEHIDGSVEPGDLTNQNYLRGLYRGCMDALKLLEELEAEK